MIGEKAPVRELPVLDAGATAPRHQFGLVDVDHCYGPNRVLSDVTITLQSGRVHGLIGQNGAGKSTVVKLLSGAITPTMGEVRLDGQALRLRSPADARHRGVLTIHQDPQLFPNLDVATNVLGLSSRLPRAHGLIDRARSRAAATRLLEELGIDVDPSQEVSALPLAEQRLVEIAAAMVHRPTFLILDEVTASLEAAASTRVLDLVRSLAQQGTGIAVISHRLAEIQEYSDEVTVLREGKVVDRLVAPVSEVDMVAGMLGSEGAQEHREAMETRHVPTLSQVMVAVEELELPSCQTTISFDVHAGEVLGVTGVLGSGAPDLVRVLGGALRATCVATVKGRRLQSANPRSARRSGVAFLSGDRRREGIAPDQSIAGNMALSCLSRLSRFGVVSGRRLRDLVAFYRDGLHIRMGDPQDVVTTLSGGNQQKVLIARALASDPVVITVDEPTQGVDIGARRQIHALLREFAGGGGAVVVFSSDPEELSVLCDRVLVLQHGRITQVLNHSELNAETIALAGAGAYERVPSDPRVPGETT